MEKETYILFVDESGNSGTNWLDKDNSYFIQGGWLVPKSKINIFENKYKNLINITQSDELKSKNVLKNEKNYKIIGDTFNGLLHDSILPFAIIAEKKFLLCAKLIESLLDPEYNKILSNDFSCDLNLKNKIANYIYDLNIDFSEFNRLYSKKIELNNEKYKIIETIKKNVIAHIPNCSNLIKCFNNADQKTYNLILEEFDIGANNMKSIVTTSLVALLQKVYPFIRGTENELEIKYDTLRGFDNIFETIKEAFFHSVEASIQVGDLTMYPNMKNITNLSMCDSKSNLFIQLSDLFCGFLNKICKKIVSNTVLNDIEKEWLNYIYCLIDKVHSIELIASDKFKIQIASRIFNKDSAQYFDNYNIDKAISKYIKL